MFFLCLNQRANQSIKQQRNMFRYNQRMFYFQMMVAYHCTYILTESGNTLPLKQKVAGSIRGSDPHLLLYNINYLLFRSCT